MALTTRCASCSRLIKNPAPSTCPQCGGTVAGRARRTRDAGVAGHNRDLLREVYRDERVRSRAARAAAAAGEDLATVYMLRHVESGEFFVRLDGEELFTGDVSDSPSFESAEDAEAFIAEHGLDGFEVAEVQIGGGDIEDFLDGNTAEVTARIKACNDAETLRIAREAEAARAKPRKGVLSALDARLGEVEA